jgi:uncharacterized protein (TIGR04141 family)
VSEKTNKLSICLIKNEYTEFDQIADPDAQSHELAGVGTFYCEHSEARPPDWVANFFRDGLGAPFVLLTASAKGLLLVRIPSGARTRIFAVLFGHGRHLLNEGVVEERFGLKVVLNSVIPNSLRSIDKTTLGSVPKQSREQMSRESEAANFGIDIEQDLVNAVTGRSKDARLGKTISGRDTLSVSVKIDVTEILGFLPTCLERFESEDYKADFEWIDQIKDVRNPIKVDELNNWLVDHLKNADLDKIWMAPPTVLDWVDVNGFRYSAKKNADLYLDLDVREFIATLGAETITLDLLKSKSAFAISSRSNDTMERWSAYKCFYAEAHIGDHVFILNNGKWYEVAPSFTEQVLADFAAMPESEVILPNYSHANEGEYNDALPALVAGACSMDRKMIRHGGGHSSIEFCDLLTADKRLIHIKRYSGAAQLSHLFNQGVVSGELFVQEETFRAKLNEELPNTHKLADVAQRPDPREYEVVFAVISKSNNPLEIPFFSKVSLRNARRRLRGYGYRVSIKKIGNISVQ